MFTILLEGAAQEEEVSVALVGVQVGRILQFEDLVILVTQLQGLRVAVILILYIVGITCRVWLMK